MTISQEVVTWPGSEMSPGSGSGDGGDGSMPPVSGGGDGGGSTPPVGGGGDGGGGSTPPVGGGDGGGGSTPPVSGGGNGGGGSAPPVGGGGDGGGGSTPPVGGGVTIGLDPLLTVGLNGDGLAVNVLTPPDPTDGNGLNVNVIGTGDGQNLIDLGLSGTGSGEPGDPLGLGSLISVGPGGPDGDGLSLNVLAPQDTTDTNGLNLNVLGNGNGENLIDVGLPNLGNIGLPGTGNGETGNGLGLGSLLSVSPGGPDGDGLSLNVLAPPDASDTNGLNVNVLGNGNGENLIDLGLPNIGGLGQPGAGDGGSDSPLGLGSLLSVSPAGPEGDGLSLNVLAPTDATDTNGLNVNALGNGNGENLIDVGLPNIGGPGLPGTGDGGASNPLGTLSGLLSGTIGNLGDSSSGHLVDLDLGPETPNGQSVDLLATPGTDPTHALSVSAIDVGEHGPQLLDLGVLTGAGGVLDVPSLGGTGTDGLTGNLLGTDGLLGGLLGGAGLAGGLLNGDIASGNTASAPVTPLDVTALSDTITAPLAGDHGLLDLHGVHLLA